MGRGNQNSFLDSSQETRLGEQQPRPQAFPLKMGQALGTRLLFSRLGVRLSVRHLRPRRKLGRDDLRKDSWDRCWGRAGQLKG